MARSSLGIRQLCHGMAKTETMDTRVWHMLLSELEFKGKLDLKKCALDGSFVRAKRGANKSAEHVEVQPVSGMPS